MLRLMSTRQMKVPYQTLPLGKEGKEHKLIQMQYRRIIVVILTQGEPGVRKRL